MANHSNKHNKDSQKQNQISNKEQQPVQMSSESGNVSGTVSGLDGVQSELSRMNTNMEKMLGCFYRLMHDRGKELDHREALFDEEIGVQGQIKDMNGGIGSNIRRIESKSFDRKANQIRCSDSITTSDQTRPIDLSFKCGFDSQFKSSSMASEASFMSNLSIFCDSNASRHGTSNRSSEILEVKIQALCNFVNRSQNENEEEDLVKAEVLLVDEEPEIKINCGAAHSNIERNDESYDAENEKVKMSENGAAKAIIRTEMSENGVAKNGLLQIIFNDPFYDAIK